MKNNRLERYANGSKRNQPGFALLAIFVILLSLLGGANPASALRPFVSGNQQAEPPSWLDEAKTADALATDRSYAILAGKLINLGLVNAKSCPGNGLMGNGNASPCGEIAARDAVILWQNQYDEQILLAAKANNVPPFLLKNILAIESQFWPSRHMTIYGYYEYGLGHITQMGADTILHWNPETYTQFCRSVFTAKTCEKPYTWLPDKEKATLRGAVLRAVSGDCEHCAGGVNLTQAKTSIPVIAAALRANYNNAFSILDSHSTKSIETIGRSDIWRLAASNYNAGPGCIESAVKKTARLNMAFNWKNISGQFDEGCQGAIKYVDTISNVDAVDTANLETALQDTSKAAQMVLGNEFATPTAQPTVAEPTHTPEATATQAPTITPNVAVTQTLEAQPTLVVEETQPVLDGTETPTPLATITEQPSPTVTAEQPTAMPTPYVPDPETGDPELSESVIVKFRPFVPVVIEKILIDLAEGDVTGKLKQAGITIMDVPAGSVDSVLEDLNGNLFVEYAEPDYVGQWAGTPPTDTYYLDGHQQNLAAMQTGVEAWDISTGTGSVVAVIDTGVSSAHPELLGRIWTNDDNAGNGDNDNNGYVDDTHGWNFVDGSPDVLTDQNGHGTHTAGIIAANNDGQGMVGVAPGAKVMVLKALNESGYGKYSDVVAAIHYAVDNGADVIQLGFAGEYNSDALLEATNYAYANNVTVIAATGNTGTDAALFPAANPHVIGVGAVDSSFTNLASFSTFGIAVDLVAPGSGILSAVPGGGYAGWSGTSVSSAQVSGLVALLANQGTSFDTPDKVAAALYGTAKELGSSNSFGAGMPQVYLAMTLGAGFVTPTPGPTAASTTMPEPPDGFNLPQYEEFWAYNEDADPSYIDPREQSCTDNLAISLTISDIGANAIGPEFPDAAEGFDNTWATCAGTFASGGSWLIPDFVKVNSQASTSIPVIEKVVLNARFYFEADGASTWADDEYALQISPDDGYSWVTISSFNATNPPPLSANANVYVDDVSDVINTNARLKQFRLRLLAVGQGPNNQAETIQIRFDQVKLEVTANQLPLVKIAVAPTIELTPGATSTYDKGDTVTLTASAQDAEDGVITGSAIRWYSDIDGYLASGTALNSSTLTPGTHSITATVTDSENQTATSAALSITVNHDNGPHGSFSTSTDACALCHRVHSAQSAGDILSYPSSSYENNDFCLTCHSASGSATVVVTHSNLHYSGKAEADFELLCIQCHDSHGNTGNIFSVRANLYSGQRPTNFTSMTRLTDAVTFTSLTGANSFDNTGTSSALCVACHIGLTTSHTGGSGHAAEPVGAGTPTPTPIDYTGQSCIKCHTHTYTTTVVESGTPVKYPNGFMAATPTATTTP